MSGPSARPVTTIVVTAETELTRALRHTRLLLQEQGAGGEAPLLVIWYRGLADEHLDPSVRTHHPSDREDGLVVLARRLGAPGRARLVDRARSAHLWALFGGHPRARVVLDGAAALVAVPWLRGHIGEVVGIVHPGDHLPAEGPRVHLSRLVVPAGTRLPARVTARTLEVVDPEPVPTQLGPAPLQITVLGPLDAENGIDLVPRLLWHLDRGPDAGAVVRWSDPEGPAPLPLACRQDLRRLGLSGRITAGGLDAGATSALEGADVVLAPHRDGQVSVVDRDAAAAHGLITVAFEGRRADGTADAVERVPFPDLAAMGAALSTAARDSSRRSRLASSVEVAPRGPVRRTLLAHPPPR